MGTVPDISCVYYWVTVRSLYSTVAELRVDMCFGRNAFCGQQHLFADLQYTEAGVETPEGRHAIASCHNHSRQNLESSGMGIVCTGVHHVPAQQGTDSLSFRE